MAKKAAPKAAQRMTTLWIKTDPRLQKEFSAACKFSGRAIQDVINGFMRSYVKKFIREMSRNSEVSSSD
jgi:hypothetical protein